MTSHDRIITVLLKLYPREWRRQYGDELLDVLDQRPLTAATVGDVLRAALWQRLRSLTPGTLMGLGSMAVIVAYIVGTPRNTVVRRSTNSRSTVSRSKRWCSDFRYCTAARVDSAGDRRAS